MPLLAWLALSCAMPCAYAQTDEESGVAAKQEETDAKTKPKPPSSPPVSFRNYLSGRFAESQGDTKSGIQFQRESLRQDADNKDKQKSLYRMLVLTGEMEEAITLAHSLEGVKGVVDEGSEFSPEMLLAIEEAKTGQYAGADKHLATIPKTGFNSLLVPLLRSWLKLGMQGVKSPIDVKDMTPDGHVILPHVYLNAALINDIAGYDTHAQKQYESSVKDPRIEPFRAVQALANFYGRKNLKARQTKLVQDYIAAHGDSYLAEELLGKSGDGSHRLVSNTGEGLAEVFYTLANIFHGVRSPADEVASLHLALYLRPDFPAAQFLLANAYELGQNYKDAVAEYKSIRSDSPYYTRGRIRTAYDQIELGQKDQALSALDTLAGEQPDDIDALLAKGDILRAAGQFPQAIGVYDKAIERLRNPKKRDWIVYYSRGASYQLMGNPRKAEADMQKALALNPTEPEILNYLGYSWLTLRQNLPQAKKMVEQAYNARPEDAHIIDSMGYSHYVSGDFAGAEEYFGQALERTPNDPTVNDHLGDTYWQLGRKTEARYQWERALTDKPDADTEKDLRKKLKEGLEVIKPAAGVEHKTAHPESESD